MNSNAARLVNWTEADLHHYFGLKSRAGRNCPFRRRQDFVPGASVTLGEAAPAQLHNTERHEGTALYVHLSKGAPDLKSGVVDMLDGIPISHAMMRTVYYRLRERDEEAWLTINAIAYRASGETIESLADAMGVVRQTMYDRRDRGIRKLSEYLDDEMHRISGET